MLVNRHIDALPTCMLDCICLFDVPVLLGFRLFAFYCFAHDETTPRCSRGGDGTEPLSPMAPPCCSFLAPPLCASTS